MTVEIEFTNKLAVQPPPFLNSSLFQEVLEYALKDCDAVQINKIVIDAGSATGDNFLGVIYRVKLHYQRVGHVGAKDGVISCIVKFIPDSEANEFLHDSNVFLKEKVVYRHVLPRMTALCSTPEKFGAELYHSVREPLRTFIFEDLNTCNFSMASRESGLDLVHASAVLQKLGKFHATTMLLAKKEPHVLSCFRTGLISKLILKDDGLPLRYYGGEIAVMESIVRTWPGYEKIADNIAKYRQNFRENLLRAVAPSEQDIKVLNHGDLWVNNVLFKYDERKKPIDITFVDFQMSIWGSLGLDLNYFFNTSVQLEVLQQHHEYLLRVYHNSLREALQALRWHQIPTFEQVEDQVQRRMGWGFFASFAILPLITLDKEESSDNNLDNMNNDEFALKKIQKMFANPTVVKQLKYNLKKLEKDGFFETLL